MSMIDPAYASTLMLKQISKNKIDYQKILNPEQYEAVITTEGAVLIVAGAGTGKTNTLTKRVMYLIDVKNVQPEQILLLTFTNKAANEMKERAKNTLDERCSRVKACTYHSFCAEQLRKYAGLIGINNDFIMYDTEDSAEVFGLIKERENISREDDVPPNKMLINMLSASINRNWSVKYLLENVYPDYEEKEEIIKKLFNLYKEYKAENNAMDYDDLLTAMNLLLEKYPDKVARKISDLYRYIMVDEYQDSNLLQLQLLIKLRQFENKNICVVGDDFQSIYGFRGSNFKNIMEFPKQFAPCKIIKLVRNYRSNQEILDLSNAVMSQAREKYEKDLIGQKHADHKPYLVYVDNQYVEAEIIFNTIQSYHNKGVLYKDMAVIVHSSNDSSRLEVLLGSKVPYKKFGGIRFTERAFVKDIFAFLRLITDKKDEISWFRILKLLPGIGPAGAKKITENVLQKGIDELLTAANRKKEKNTFLESLYVFFKDMEHMEFYNQLEYIIKDFYPNLIKAGILAKKNLDEGSLQDRLSELNENMEQAKVLIDMAQGYKTASSFLTDMLLEATVKADESDDFLTITTVHSVKGLEFKVVFLIDCINYTFPWQRNPKAFTQEAMKNAEEEFEEERRVFYVAITRAKDDLYMFVPYISGYGNRKDITEVSPFISGFVDDLCDIEDYRSDSFNLYERYNRASGGSYY